MDAKRYKFFTPTHLFFGEGCSGEVGQRIKALGGTRALLVSDKGLERTGLVGKVKAALEAEGLAVVVYADVSENPTGDNVHAGRDLIREHGLDVVVALGGGSPMDAAKAMSALAVHEGAITEYEYGLKPFLRPGPTIVAIPTTAGTGAEATMGAVITDLATHRKIDVVSPLMAPRLALVDPEVTVSLPPGMTAATGMDALTHSVEGYTATLAHPLTDAIHLQAITLLGKYLLRAYRDGTDKDARYHTMMASMIAGIGFPNSGLGAGARPGPPARRPFQHRPRRRQRDLAAPCDGVQPARQRGRGCATSRWRWARTGRARPVRSTMSSPSAASSSCRSWHPSASAKEHLDALARDALGRNSNCVTNPRPVTEADAKEI